METQKEAIERERRMTEQLLGSSYCQLRRSGKRVMSRAEFNQIICSCVRFDGRMAARIAEALEADGKIRIVGGKIVIS